MDMSENTSNMDADLDEEAEEIGIRFRDDRRANDLHLKARFEEIFRKYERDFTGVGDEIDLLTGDIVLDNGHLQSMQHEIDTGDNTTSFIVDLTLDEQPGSGDATPDIEDESDFDDALDSLGREIDELSETSADDSGQASNAELELPKAPQRHAAGNLAALGELPRTSAIRPALDAQWHYPELPEDSRTENSKSIAKANIECIRDKPKASPSRSRSIWAPERRPGRPRTRKAEDSSWLSEDSDDEDSAIDLARLPPDLLSLHASMGRVPAFQQIYAANTARRLAPRRPLPNLASAGTAQNHFFDALRPESDALGQHAIVRQSLEAMKPSHLTQLAYQRYMLQHQKAAARATQHRKLYTKQEDELIIELHWRKGLPWVQIRDRYLPERNLESLLNRWTYLRRRVIGDLIENGELGPDDKAGSKSIADKVNGFKLSASYRADALRASLLAKNDDSTSMANDEDEDENDLSAVGQIRSKRFSAQDDAKIKKLRDEDKLLFAEIAKQLPGHDESSITDRYYSHILGRASPEIYEAAAKARPIDKRQYLRHEHLPVLSPPTTPLVQDTGKLQTILPALGSLPLMAAPAPSEVRGGPASFVVNHKLLKRTRRRKKKINGEYVFVDSKRVQEAFAGTDGSSLPKWAVAANTRQDSPDEPSEDQSMVDQEPTTYELSELQHDASHQTVTRLLPSSIPDTEEEPLLSSNSARTDRQQAISKLPAPIQRSLPAAAKSRVHEMLQHKPRERQLLPADSAVRLQDNSELQSPGDRVKIYEPAALPRPPSHSAVFEDTHRDDEPATIMPKPKEPFQRETTPATYEQLWSGLDSSPVFEPTFYGTPARWKQQSAPYFVDEADVSAAQQQTEMLTSVAPMIDPFFDGMSTPSLETVSQMHSSGRDVCAEHLPVKRKSFGASPSTGAAKTNAGSPLRKRMRGGQPATKSRDRVVVDSDDDEVIGLSATKASALPSDQHERHIRSQSKVFLQPTPSGHQKEREKQINAAEYAHQVVTTVEHADRQMMLKEPFHMLQNRSQPMHYGTASRTTTRPKGRLSELKRALSDRRHSAPLPKTPSRQLSKDTVRRMSALAKELSDDELA